MKIQLIKEVELEGTFFMIYADGDCKGIFIVGSKGEKTTYIDALQYFDKIVENAKRGISKEILKEIEI